MWLRDPEKARVGATLEVGRSYTQHHLPRSPAERRTDDMYTWRGSSPRRAEREESASTVAALPASMVRRFEVLSAVVAFMAASAGMMIVNKLVMRGSHLPITIVIIQMLFTVVTIVVVPGMRRAIRFGSARDVWRWTRAVPPLFALMLSTSMLALDHATMGAFIVVRNLAPVPALLSEAFIDRSLKIDLQTMLAMALSLAGVILYARNDLHSSPLGFLFMGINLCAAVLERLVQRTLIALDPIDVSKQV